MFVLKAEAEAAALAGFGRPLFLPALIILLVWVGGWDVLFEYSAVSGGAEHGWRGQGNDRMSMSEWFWTFLSYVILKYVRT